MRTQNTKIKYAMYLRKSTDSEDRQVQSIEDQRREMIKCKEQFNLNVIATYQENKSAKQPGRLEFNKMMADVKIGKIQGILCWKINRLARNPVDGGEIQWLLQQGLLQNIITPGKEYKTDDNTIMMAVELGMANQFVLDLSKDVKRGLYSKAEKGWRPGRAPAGYENDKLREKGEKRVLASKERFPIVRKMWDMMLTGNYTVSQVHKKATEDWGLRIYNNKKETKISLNAVYRIFTNTFYYGEFKYGGKIYEGKHKPMITTAEFDRVQKILGKKGVPRAKHKSLPFAGVIRCGECGYSITADEKIKYIKEAGRTKSYIYHKCTKRSKECKCAQKPISYSKLEKQILSQLDNISIPQSFLNHAISIINKKNDMESKDRNIILKNQQRVFNNCCKEIDNLLRLYISPENVDRELLDSDEFKDQKSRLLKEKNSAKEKINKLSNKMDEWIELTEKTFEFATYAKVWFQKGDYSEKTKILRALGSNFVLKDGKLSITLLKSYQTLENGLKTIKEENPTFELADFAMVKTKTTPFKAVSELLSG